MVSVLMLSSAIAIFTSFLCSVAESLLLSLNPLTLSQLQATNPSASASWRRLKSNVARPITAILVLNTVAHTGGATVAGGAFAEIYGEHRIWVFSLLFTVVILFGTEILPKVIGVSFRDRLAPVAGPVVEALTTVMRPVVLLSEAMFKRLTSRGESDQITTADLVTLASLARSGKAINLEQENIIVNAVRLTHTQITHAMIPPGRVQFITDGAPPDAVLALMRKSGHTRYPVSRSDSVEDIYAYIVAKKAVPATDEDTRRLVAEARPIHTVNHRANLMSALQAMLLNREHLLSVVDDRARCVGIVTLEDIASELLSADIEEFR